MPGLALQEVAAAATARGAGALSEADLREGLRSVFEDRLGTLGTPITRSETMDSILEFMSRISYRRQVYEDWGFARKVGRGPGIGAPCGGRPGTGKTLLASLLAAELKMEQLDGVTHLTTHFDGSIDAAFRRRLAFKIDFAFPDVAERTQLWQAMLPKKARTDGPIDFEELGTRYAMAGGNIRNAVVRAAFLAAQEHSGITMGHLVRAAQLEYTAMGKVTAGTPAARYLEE